MFRSDLLQNKRILITGGGTGLGKGMAKRFLELGATVYICGRRGSVVEETAKEIAKAHNTRVTGLECDIRVADALDMAQGRSRLPIEGGQYGIHALSAAAIDEVRIEAGDDRPVKIEIEMNNSAGVFQVDDLLATKIRGTPLEGHVEVIAEVAGETEKRLLPSFRI